MQVIDLIIRLKPPYATNGEPYRGIVTLIDHEGLINKLRLSPESTSAIVAVIKADADADAWRTSKAIDASE